MEENNQVYISRINSFVISVSLTLHLFWILNVFKAANKDVANFLTFYKPIGPLLGLFLISFLSFIIFLIIFRFIKLKSQAFSLWFFIISIFLFFFMVFPPIFEPIAHYFSR